MKPEPVECELFAFWRYDVAPYVIGAKVTKMNGKGQVWAPSYQGWFNPIKLLPLPAGKDLHADILRLSRKYYDAVENLKNDLDANLYEIIPELEK